MKRFYLFDIGQISHSLKPDVAIVPMLLKNISNSNGNGNEHVEISGGNLGNINDAFG